MNKPQLNLEESIASSSLTLEPILPKHALLLFSSLQAIDLYTYIPFDAPKSLKDLELRYQHWSARQSSEGSEIWLNYAIYSRTICEYVGTLQSTLEASGKTYIAYEIFPPYWRRGIAREAVGALIAHLFEDFSVSAVSAHVDTRNSASYKLLESLNFQQTTVLKDADHFKGHSSDEYVYDLAQVDWLANSF